jgi:hypothetical protein
MRIYKVKLNQVHKDVKECNSINVDSSIFSKPATHICDTASDKVTFDCVVKNTLIFHSYSNCFKGQENCKPSR